MDSFKPLLDNIAAIITVLVAAASALIVIFQKIPGDEPEKTLQKFVNFIARHSKKNP